MPVRKVTSHDLPPCSLSAHAKDAATQGRESAGSLSVNEGSSEMSVVDRIRQYSCVHPASDQPETSPCNRKVVLRTCV